jgi:hypothetical protein
MDRSSERGSILIVVALSSVALLAIGALSIDASFMFDMKNRLASVADSAAKSAAYEIKRGNVGNYGIYAQAEVQRAIDSGLAPAGTVIESIHRCSDVGATCSAAYAFPGYVEVIVNKTQPTFFASILGIANMTPRARSVAGIANPNACLIVMRDLTLGNATVNMGGCMVQVGRNLTGNNPGSDIIGNSTVTGSCSGQKPELCDDGSVQYPSAPAPINPFANLTAPVVAGPCSAPPIVNPLPPGCYTSIPATITSLQAGVFKVTGQIDIAAKLSAPNGTLLYLTDTASIQGNTAELQITASNTIAGYEGIAIYGDPNSFIDFKNSLTLTITGAVVMSGSNVIQKNHLRINDTGCTVMVFNDFETKNGDGLFLENSSCWSLFSGAKYLDVALAE